VVGQEGIGGLVIPSGKKIGGEIGGGSGPCFVATVCPRRKTADIHVIVKVTRTRGAPERR